MAGSRADARHAVDTYLDREWKQVIRKEVFLRKDWDENYSHLASNNALANQKAMQNEARATAKLRMNIGLSKVGHENTISNDVQRNSHRHDVMHAFKQDPDRPIDKYQKLEKYFNNYPQNPTKTNPYNLIHKRTLIEGGDGVTLSKSSLKSHSSQASSKNVSLPKETAKKDKTRKRRWRHHHSNKQFESAGLNATRQGSDKRSPKKQPTHRRHRREKKYDDDDMTELRHFHTMQQTPQVRYGNKKMLSSHEVGWEDQTSSRSRALDKQFFENKHGRKCAPDLMATF